MAEELTEAFISLEDVAERLNNEEVADDDDENEVDDVFKENDDVSAAAALRTCLARSVRSNKSKRLR